MNQQQVTRTQRREERKQGAALMTLFLAIALVCFVFGFMVGRGTAPRAAAVQARQVESRPLPPPPSAGGEARGEGDLTFFDALPKGQQPPLGSGINLPPRSAVPPRAQSPAPDEPKERPAEAVAEQPASSAPVRAPAAKPPAAPVTVAKEAPAPVPAKSAAAPPPARPASPPAASGGAFVVQAAAFRDSADAKGMQARLARKGYSAYVQEANLGEKGIWFRVFVGPYGDAASADAAVRRLKAEERLSGMIKRR